MPFDKNVNYGWVLDQFYRTLYTLNVETDFVFPQNPRFEDYALIVVPPLYIASDALLERLSAYVKGGGHVLAAFKSGFCDENSTVRWTMAPGPLREAAGFRYQEFSTLTQPLTLKGDPFKAGAKNEVSIWAELLIPETARALAYYDHPFFGKYPAVTRNSFGKGTFTYEGTVLSEALQESVMRDALAAAGVAMSDAALPAGSQNQARNFGRRPAASFLLQFFGARGIVRLQIRERRRSPRREAGGQGPEGHAGPLGLADRQSEMK